MILFCLILMGYYCTIDVNAYRNNLFNIVKPDHSRAREYKCSVYEGVDNKTTFEPQNALLKLIHKISNSTWAMPIHSITRTTVTTTEENPFEEYQNYLHQFLFGKNIEIDGMALTIFSLRSELFNNRAGVHLPLSEFMLRGYCSLKVSKDYMQTAVNAFAIFLYGTLDDIERLPPDYVLRSARTISMMKIAREKLAATWYLIKAGTSTEKITIQTLEMYRPLFKYVNGREIARLNLSDEDILTYIGTHADLDRHQVGVVASEYLQLNKRWSEPRYLNVMNNLLCGVPMQYMRSLPINTYLQLSNQVFYHVRACDPLQKRFYLAMMTRTKALGKSYSWNSNDVARLGLLLTEVEGPDLSAINPEAMSGITAQVMMLMSPENLQFLTENQLRYLSRKPLNILTRKLKLYNDQLQFYGYGLRTTSDISTCLVLVLTTVYVTTY